MSTDEMTAIQALERIAPDIPMSPGKPVAVEFEYKRHGTQTLIAAINIATGTVCGWVGDTRTEESFAHFIEWVIQHNPGYRTHHFVLDQINTHKSETLVRTTARLCGLNIDLGMKGKTGILQSVETREEFLSQPDKAVVFHYRPKHASWMNQIEIWFGILDRKVVWLARRVWNFRTISYSAVRYTLFQLTKELRDRDPAALSEYLRSLLDEQPESFAGSPRFRLHMQNYRQVRHMVARLTHWVDEQCGVASHFEDLISQGRGRPFEIEHIWADKYERFSDWFQHPSDFETERNRLRIAEWVWNPSRLHLDGEKPPVPSP